MINTRITPLKFQAQARAAIKLYTDITFFFMIAGYRSGKSNCLGQQILEIAIKYKNQDVVIGVCAPTISLIYKTFMLDLEIILKRAHIDFKLNRQDNILYLNGVTFVFVGIDYPTNIYGYTFNAVLCDELDELPLHNGWIAFEAMHERCSKPFPDGRIPYIAIYSTAQGYKTIYKIIQDLKEKKIPYVKVRGCTKDNIYNDPSYYETRYKLYTENERLAFLEGHFVNLTTGRVYPEFDDNYSVIDDIEIEPGETVYIGQDINSGFSKAVCFVKRDKNLIAVKEFSFAAIGDAPTIIRNAFPTNDITWFPDASSKEIMAGYAMEIRNAGINLWYSSINPSILERIFIINKLFKMRRLFIIKKCTGFINAMKLRQFDKLGKPEKGQGSDAPDHFSDASEYCCFRIVMSDSDFNDFRTFNSTQRMVS